MQQRIQWNHCGGSSRSLHWNCSISSFLLQAVPSSHKSLISTSCWSGIDMKDVITCHTPMCKAHGDMRCRYATVFIVKWVLVTKCIHPRRASATVWHVSVYVFVTMDPQHALTVIMCGVSARRRSSPRVHQWASLPSRGGGFALDIFAAKRSIALFSILYPVLCSLYTRLHVFAYQSCCMDGPLWRYNPVTRCSAKESEQCVVSGIWRLWSFKCTFNTHTKYLLRFGRHKIRFRHVLVHFGFYTFRCVGWSFTTGRTMELLGPILDAYDIM